MALLFFGGGLSGRSVKNQALAGLITSLTLYEVRHIYCNLMAHVI